MVKPSIPIFASERTAAALLDMKPAEFRSFVAAGALPPAGKFGRWDVDELARAMRGDVVEQRLDL